MNPLAENYYLKYKVEHDIITESYVVFKYNGNLYSLKGGDGGTSYDANKTLLTNVFGSANCTDGSDSFRCSIGGLYGQANTNGYVAVAASDYSSYCFVDNSGSSGCNINS